ncbi:MAG: hypothetical protein GY832_22835 [Chloroflexi bacterium]|nr:hypothetical protein [Chloroflexota bacterium]
MLQLTPDGQLSTSYRVTFRVCRQDSSDFRVLFQSYVNLQRVECGTSPFCVIHCAAILEYLEGARQGCAGAIYFTTLDLHLALVVQSAAKFQAAAELVELGDSVVKGARRFVPRILRGEDLGLYTAGYGLNMG